MLFYHFEQLEDFIQSDFIINLKSEKEELSQIIDLYECKKTNLLSNSFQKINDIQKLSLKLQNDLITMISLYETNIEDHLNEIKANLVEYNKQRDNLSKKILEFEKENTVFLSNIIKPTCESPFQKNTKILKQNASYSKIDIELNPYDNNTLIISEKDQFAYLPFFYEDIKNIYKNEKSSYPTLQDVVNQNYIIPLNKFKNSTFSRFREAFQLMRKKEKASIPKSLDLGLEMMFRYELNPIVISACRNLDELDIYLNCLDEKDTYDFPCFQIRYEITPQVLKNKK